MKRTPYRHGWLATVPFISWEITLRIADLSLDVRSSFSLLSDSVLHNSLIINHLFFSSTGCWGVKVSQNRSSIVRAATSMFTQNHLHEYDYDQKLLDKLIWPIAYNNMVCTTPLFGLIIRSRWPIKQTGLLNIYVSKQMAHDSYCCERLPLTQPYPTKRKDGLFIGWRAVPKEELQFPCPPKCRPANTSDWSFCWINMCSSHVIYAVVVIVVKNA